MTNQPLTVDMRSLATARPGESVQIRCILFDGVRTMCDRLGLRPGDTVVVGAATPARIGLTRADGTGTLLERRWAEFIQIATDPGSVRAA